MEIATCKLCGEPSHHSNNCPELHGSLYGKFGEGAQKGHSHEEDDSCRSCSDLKCRVCLPKLSPFEIKRAIH